MEHLHDVEEARHYVEEAKQAKEKLDLSTVAINLDAAAEQENAECQEEMEEVHPDYLHLDPGNHEEIEDNIQQQNIYRKINLPNIHTLKEKTRKLDPYQRSVIDIGIKYAKDIVKARRRKSITRTTILDGPWWGRSWKVPYNQYSCRMGTIYITSIRR